MPGLAADELESTIQRIFSALRELKLPFHFTGGLAAAFYGEPRFTQDIDLVLRIPAQASAISQLVGLLGREFFVDEQSAEKQIRENHLLQALDQKTMIKVDLHIGEAIPDELSRSSWEEILPGLRVPLVSPEDSLLSKLLWLKKGSEKSRRDAEQIVRRKLDLDWASLEKRAGDLGLSELLAEISVGRTKPIF